LSLITNFADRRITNKYSNKVDNKKHLQFKTNINCSGCVAAVKPHLDKLISSESWQVDTSNKDKILSVDENTISEEEIINTVQKAGFKIEAINK
jgi:copper chaperone